MIDMALEMFVYFLNSRLGFQCPYMLYEFSAQPSKCTEAVVSKLCSAVRKAICDQFPEDPWIHFCTGYFEVHFTL